VRGCFETLKQKEFWSPSWKVVLFPCYRRDESGVQSLAIAIYLAYRHEKHKQLDEVDFAGLRSWPEVGRGRELPKKFGPLHRIVFKDRRRHPFPFRTFCWELLSSHKPAYGSQILIVSFKGEICRFSASYLS
jgi:hypothetical protein